MRKAMLIALVAASGLLLEFPGRAEVVDLGTIAIETSVNGEIVNFAFPSNSESYTYQQSIFQGPDLGLTLDSGSTIADVLATDLGPAINGTLVHDFPFPSGGASGSYFQAGVAIIGLSPGTTLDLKATSQSGHVYPGFNNVGAIIDVDPINAAMIYSTILGGTGVGLSNGFPSESTVDVIVPLGSIGGTEYQGELMDTTWTTTATVRSAGSAAIPEPRIEWVGLVVFFPVVTNRSRHELQN